MNSLARPFLRLALEGGQQVVPVEVDLVGHPACRQAGQRRLLHVWLAGGGQQRRQPVLVRDDLVDLGAGLDHAGPAHDQRHAIAALPVGVLLAAERRRAAVGPAEHLGAVVGRPDHDRVVGDAQVVQLLQELADVAVVLDHAVRADSEPGLALRLGLEVGVDVHAGRVEPDEPGLAALLLLVDELDRGGEHLLVHRLHPLLRQRAGVLAALLAPLAEAGVVGECARGVGRVAMEHAARAEHLLELRVSSGSRGSRAPLPRSGGRSCRRTRRSRGPSG